MKKASINIGFICAVLVLFCFSFSCQLQETGEPESIALTDADIAAMKASTETFGQAWASKDYDTLMALYTTDAIMMPPNAPLAQGGAALRAFMENFPPVKEANLTIEEIDGRKDLAYVRGSYSITIEMEGVPEPVLDTGKYIEIRVKQQDGSWLISRDIFNSDLPLQD
jgi:ketosteroid isomerase-like protein